MSEDTPAPTNRKRRERPDYGWPAAMKRSTAAAYLDISEESLNREVGAGRMPMPFKLGGRDHWRKDAIDAAISHLTGGDIVPEYRRRLYERHAPNAYDEWKASQKK